MHREVKEVSNLIAEMTAPYKALQQATKWLDQQEACQLLGISKRILQQYRDDGLIAFIKLERKILFRESNIVKVLEDNYQR